MTSQHYQTGDGGVAITRDNCRNISIALINAEKGEETAQACEIT
jgi:hypothetical protein